MEMHTILVFRHLPLQEYFPNSHGTSIHSDYWYGHGLSAITTWVPILNSISGATFYADHRKILNNYIDEHNFDLNYLKKLQKKYL